LCRDLIFTTKVKETAASLGFQMLVASDELLAKSLIETQRPRVVLVDLTAGALAAPSALRAYRELAGSDAWFVAFGPHVEADTLAAARAAGCQAVMPRSKFTALLPLLMRQWFSGSALESG
jgi:hypothetical protein